MQSRILLNTLSVLCSGALLLACSNLVPHDEPKTPAAVSNADEAYLRGRNLHLAHHYDEAIAAYQTALRDDPAHVNALNGLAIAYAEQRDFDKAVPIWRELTRGATLSSGPAVAYLFGNLGYAYFLDGQYEKAAVALEKACLLNPLNDRAWQYLGETLQKLGQDERAQQMLRQASALREHDLRADYAAAGAKAKSPALAQALATPVRADGDWAVEVVGKPGGILELRRVVSSSAAKRIVTPAAATLEISNGNGRQGIARQLSRQLRDAGVKVVRITNEKGFGVRQTRIEYHQAFRGVAQQLAELIGAGAPVEIESVGRSDLRLVIGHDLPSRKIPKRASDLLAARAGAAGAP
ncbi:LytR C-terminal domain-containing protein [Massilia sp. 9096]|uniref:LytR C-terminal domain-containing protein n=1 Tax=Massilia sp. 9096 TaxID=1500894 RepID=UPI0009DED1A7|nr:LytR C-terminal domain-containing protein [Massilia sp. 9096]